MTKLDGRRVLLVEDESLVAMMAEDMLIELGCVVVVAMRLDQALALAHTGAFDAAVLDVNLGDARSYPVADVLFEREVPFLFATGYGVQGLEPTYQDVPVLQKPYQQPLLAHLLDCLFTEAAPPRKRTDPSPGLGCACTPAPASVPTFRADTPA